MEGARLLIDCEALRVARADGTLSDALTVAAAGPTVALIGQFAPLFALLSGEATLASGRAELLGVSARLAVARGEVGFAPLDPLLPPTWTVERYFIESAQLSGMERARATRAAREVADRFELSTRARHHLKDLLLIERRALVLAAATLGNPPVLCAQAPLTRLDVAGQLYLANVLRRAGEGRHAIVSALELAPSGPERGLVDGADQLVWEPGAQGNVSAASAGRRLTLAVLAQRDALCAALTERGVRFESLPLDPLLLGLAPEAGASACRLLVELSEGTTKSDVVRLTVEQGAPLVELLDS
jgi:predicted ABC-type transport system involved in lysophospholipase L1 biosynthesis ATPase subunit